MAMNMKIFYLQRYSSMAMTAMKASILRMGKNLRKI
jgi:hypothetical protein